MKNRLIIGLLGLAAIQGTCCYGDATVKLSNLEAKLPLDFANAKAVAAGDGFYVQVLAGPIGGVLVPVAIADGIQTRQERVLRRRHRGNSRCAG